MRRRRPVWRGFWCLLLGGVAWWLVAWGLEPRPRWSVTSAGQLLIPLAELPDRGVVVQERALSGNRLGPRTLHLLHCQTGARLHSIPNIDDLATYSPVGLPSYQHGAYWWLADHDLMRWTPQDTQAQKLDSWELNPFWNKVLPWDTEVFWPQGSEVLIVARHWYWGALLSSVAPHASVIENAMFVGLNAMRRPSIFQSYRLPRLPDKPLDKLAMWKGFSITFGNSYAFLHGQTLMAEEVSDDLLLFAPLSRAKALGKPTLTPAEIAQCYLGNSNRVRIVDVATGKPIAELPPPRNGYYHSVSWIGNYLLAYCSEWRATEPMSLAEFQAVQAKRQDELWSKRLAIYRWDGRTLQPITFSDEPSWYSRRFRFQHDHLYSYEIGSEGNKRIIHLTAFIADGNTLVAKPTIKLLGAEDLFACDPTGTQLYFNSMNRLPYYAELYRWSEQHSWLKRILGWIRPLERPDVEVLTRNGQHASILLKNQMAINCKYFEHDLQSLFTLSHQRENGKEVATTLHCYSLPLRLYSPWWARSTGLLITLALWLLLTRRARRGVA